MKTTFLLQAALATLTSAHFTLDYPLARGFDEDKLGTFPCGGQDTISNNRTAFPLTGGSIALNISSEAMNIEVLIGYGSTVGSAFNTVLRPTFMEMGEGQFCMTGFEIPEAMNGMNATIQVVASGDEGEEGGLYNCADVTLSSTAAAVASSVCKNATGVSVAKATESGNANETMVNSTMSMNMGKSGAVAGKDVKVGGMLAMVAAAVVFGIAL